MKMERQVQKPRALRGADQVREGASSQVSLAFSQASLAVDESRGKGVEAKDSKRYRQEDITKESASTPVPPPKRRRTDAANPPSDSTTSPNGGQTASSNMSSYPRRLSEMQRSFESYVAQRAAQPRLPHSKSDPVPLSTTKVPGTLTSSGRAREEIKGPRNVRDRQEWTKHDRVNSAKLEVPRVRNFHGEDVSIGTQSRPLELSSDSNEGADSSTDDEQVPSKPQADQTASFDGANELDIDEAEGSDTQLTLSDSAFRSQEQPQHQARGDNVPARLAHRKSAYKAVQGRNGLKWDGLISSSCGHGAEEVEL